MKADTTPASLENRNCQKVVKVNQHSKQKYKIDRFPPVAKEFPGNKCWKYQVKEVMYEEL
jgi:hypothetical protein